MKNDDLIKRGFDYKKGDKVVKMSIKETKN